MFKSLSMLALFFLASFAFAAVSPRGPGVSPTKPGPGETYRAGFNCVVAWNADTTGQWKNVTLSLMSGSNTAMEEVIPVVKNLDCTKNGHSPLTWTCPAVDTYSASYFYRFMNGDDVKNAAYTMRFTIASPSGQTTSPQFAIQPDGSKVGWSNARFVSATAVNN